MEPTSALKAEKTLLDSQLKIFSVEQTKRLFNVSANTAHKMLLRWKKYGLVTNLRRNSYILSRAVNISDYEIANQLVSPSYVSLETALNFYGILPQFAYSITSVTTRKSNTITCQNKEFGYTKISLNLFWGYNKQNNALIASPEKAVIDMLYFASKKLRTIHLDEWDLTPLNKKILKQYADKISYRPFTILLHANHLL